MLDVRRLNQYYAGSHILRDVDLEVAAGACTCLMGRNGVGKTTLLRSIMGMLSIRSGSIAFRGEDLTRCPVEQRARRGIGYVPQGRMIFPLLTVDENLRIGLPARRHGPQQVPGLVYQLFPVLQAMSARRGGDLSGGQQQQLAIARSLVLEPDLLILDEPCEGIQPNLVRELADVIARLNRDLGLTVLLVEQRLAFVRQVGHRFAILDRGRVTAGGAMRELNDSLVTRYLTV